MDTLRSRLCYEPQELKFGTSGRRGEVVHLTQLEIYINALGELQYLQSLPPSEGGIARGDEFYFAYDLRPSSPAIAQAIEFAICQAGMRPVNMGRIPTPALAYYALGRGRGSMMITGSHIPFDRNGYKTYTSRGELLKEQEAPVNESVRRVREEVYAQAFGESPFDAWGLLRRPRDLPPECAEARTAYIERYTRFFGGHSLGGMRLVAYQHSAVGRDTLVDILKALGAEAIPAGREETFVPIDTENVNAALLARIQELADGVEGADAVVSMDGDSDRPLICGIDPATGRVRFFGGDVVGMVVAEYLGADAVVVPISSNDAIDRGSLAAVVEPKTRIGSPYVVAGMEEARRKGKHFVCGWEANGGFMTGSDFERNGAVLRALPTRDAMLPILAALFFAREKGLSLVETFARLPGRFNRGALLGRFPRTTAQKIVKIFSPADPAIQEVRFDSEPASGMGEVRKRLETFFTPALGFGAIRKLNYTDGVRITFENGDVAHVRPSGNADELRIYASADTQERADFIAEAGIAEPDGILRRMERHVRSGGIF